MIREAQYEAQCAECGDRIECGEQMEYLPPTGDRPALTTHHPKCPERQVKPRGVNHAQRQDPEELLVERECAGCRLPFWVDRTSRAAQRDGLLETDEGREDEDFADLAERIAEGEGRTLTRAELERLADLDEQAELQGLDQIDPSEALYDLDSSDGRASYIAEKLARHQALESAIKMPPPLRGLSAHFSLKPQASRLISSARSRSRPAPGRTDRSASSLRYWAR